MTCLFLLMLLLTLSFCDPTGCEHQPKTVSVSPGDPFRSAAIDFGHASSCWPYLPGTPHYVAGPPMLAAPPLCEWRWLGRKDAVAPSPGSLGVACKDKHQLVDTSLEDLSCLSSLYNKKHKTTTNNHTAWQDHRRQVENFQWKRQGCDKASLGRGRFQSSCCAVIPCPDDSRRSGVWMFLESFCPVA